LVAALGLVSGCDGGGGAGGDAKGAKYAVVTNGVASFWDICKAGAERAGEDLQVDVEVLMPDGVEDQKKMIEDMVTRGAAGIAVSPIDPENQTSFINDVAEETHFITMDADAPDSNRKVFVGVDNYDAGRMCGQLVKEALPDGGEVVIFVGRMEQDNAKRRRQGVIDELMGRTPDSTRFDEPGQVIKGDKYTILGTLTDQFDRAKGKANVEDMLTKHQKVGCMVGLFVYNPPLILEALKQMDKIGQVKVVGFDEADETLQGIIDGTVHGTVVQDPFAYGYQSVKVLKALHEGDTSVIPANRFIDIPAKQIRKDNVETFWAELKERLGK
jgi:ribose transport system substrate-binding protein